MFTIVETNYNGVCDVWIVMSDRGELLSRCTSFDDALALITYWYERFGH